MNSAPPDVRHALLDITSSQHTVLKGVLAIIAVKRYRPRPAVTLYTEREITLLGIKATDDARFGGNMLGAQYLGLGSLW
jgi:hypothetical protein